LKKFKQPQQASTRVVVNTGILYAKMMVTMGISLYSTRLVLNALGASDYGIFNLIAGVIAMLSFLNGAMTVSTQRYLSYHQGTKNAEMQKKVFSNSWVLHIGIGLFVVILLLALEPFWFDGFLNLPADRVLTAQKLYLFMIVSVFFTILSVPFTASLNAHENMLWVAVVQIIESVCKLAIAISLWWFIQEDRLILYGTLMAVLSMLTFTLYAVYALKKYEECSVRDFRIEKPLMKELGSFAGWNLFGSATSMSKSQAVAVLLNIFFGTIINAAYGIANQVSSQLLIFTQTMFHALNPQIMQSEGMNDRQRMLRLAMIASKFGFFLMAFIAIPVIFEMPAILQLWLKNVPEYTVVFCSLITISYMTNMLTVGLQSAVQATGKIKWIQIIIGSTVLMTIPIAYIFLKMGFPPYSVFVVYIVIEFIACVMRLFFLKKIAGLSIRAYFERVFAKEIIPMIVIIITCWAITHFLHFEYRFLLTGFVAVLVFAVSIYFTGLCEDEKVLVQGMLKKVLKKK
jgi:Na+-driven multidrug efflux pump